MDERDDKHKQVFEQHVLDRLEQISTDSREFHARMVLMDKNLADHMHRTALLEGALQNTTGKLEQIANENSKALQAAVDKMDKRVKPIEKAMDQVNGAWRLIVFLGGSFGVVAFVQKLIEVFSHR